MKNNKKCLSLFFSCICGIIFLGSINSAKSLSDTQKDWIKSRIDEKVSGSFKEEIDLNLEKEITKNRHLANRYKKEYKAKKGAISPKEMEELERYAEINSIAEYNEKLADHMEQSDKNKGTTIDLSGFFSDFISIGLVAENGGPITGGATVAQNNTRDDVVADVLNKAF